MNIPTHRRLSLLYFSILLRLISATSPTSPPSFNGDEAWGPPPPSPAPAPAPFPPWDSSDWAGYFDEYVEPPAPTPPPPPPCNPDDRDALLEIKRTFNNSNIFSSWTPGTDCCRGWEYIWCDEVTGRVANLYFDGVGNRNLPRILPPAIGNLTYLQYLRWHNNVAGPIPRALAKLQHLTSLYLSNNQFTGRIPDFLGQIPLDWLDLAGNQLTGRIPASFANSTTLRVLQLSGNRLTGRIPRSLFHLKSEDKSVITLELSYNQLTGTIPRSFGGVNFRRLFLAGNRLGGDASIVFGKGKGVWQIDLSRNKLSFNMSNVEIPPRIGWLDLSHNRIYGGLPVMYGLDYLNVSYNRLCGQIPHGGSLQQFDETAYFHNECLCGAPLPKC